MYYDIIFYSPYNHTSPRQVIIPLPTDAQSYAVRLGWWQLAETQIGAFAIDNILIGVSSYNHGSIYSETYVANVLYFTYTTCCQLYSFESIDTRNFWWSISPGGVVSSSCGSSNALVFGAGLMDRVAVTRPLAIPTTHTTPVVLREGFDVITDNTRLVNEGYVK